MSWYEFLKKVELFKNMPDEDLRQLCGMVDEVNLEEGEELFAEGDPGHRAFVIVDGELEIIKATAGREVLLAVRGAGDFIGEMALLDQAPRMASVRARTKAQAIGIHREQFDKLLNSSPTAALAMLDTVTRRLRNTTAMLRQNERMAQLGTLVAGVAHELNNPAAAVKRGSGQLHSSLNELVKAESRLNQLTLTDEQEAMLPLLQERAEKQAAQPAMLDALTRSDREYEIEEWLEDRGMENAWEMAPALVNVNYDTSELEELAQHFSAGQLPAVVNWVNAIFSANNLLAEIGQGANQISAIVKALKAYSYLDQAPVQTVDIHEGLDNTLLIMKTKLKAGIGVERDYDPDLPTIQAYGSELNQVWTNLIDNAADALDGQGTITLRTRRDDDGVVVEVEDNGSGIPPEIQNRIFDPFFTTKPPGKGTGIGLDISYNIVVHKHRGSLTVTSVPGETIFKVWLPLHVD